MSEQERFEYACQYVRSLYADVFKQPLPERTVHDVARKVMKETRIPTPTEKDSGDGSG